MEGSRSWADFGSLLYAVDQSCYPAFTMHGLGVMGVFGFFWKLRGRWHPWVLLVPCDGAI